MRRDEGRGFGFGARSDERSSAAGLLPLGDIVFGFFFPFRVLLSGRFEHQIGFILHFRNVRFGPFRLYLIAVFFRFFLKRRLSIWFFGGGGGGGGRCSRVEFLFLSGTQRDEEIVQRIVHWVRRENDFFDRWFRLRFHLFGGG